jgi:hypothetical protein
MAKFPSTYNKIDTITIIHILPYLFQKAGTKSTRAVNNSRRPIIIKSARMSLPAPGINAKFCVAPTSPNPGPILAKQAIVAVKDVTI